MHAHAPYQLTLHSVCHCQYPIGGGHFGRDKTLQKISSRFYWKNLTNAVKEYVQTCHVCQKVNSTLTKQPSALRPIPVEPAVWHQVGLDIVGPFTKTTQGNMWVEQVIAVNSIDVRHSTSTQAHWHCTLNSTCHVHAALYITIALCVCVYLLLCCAPTLLDPQLLVVAFMLHMRVPDHMHRLFFKVARSQGSSQ